MTPTDLKALLAGGETSTVEFKRDDLANHELAKALGGVPKRQCPAHTAEMGVLCLGPVVAMHSEQCRSPR